MKKSLFVILLILASCASSPDFQLYVAADRATYSAISTEYLELMHKAKDDDGKAIFDSEQTTRRERLVESWRIRIEEAEKDKKE